MASVTRPRLLVWHASTRDGCDCAASCTGPTAEQHQRGDGEQHSRAPSLRVKSISPIRSGLALVMVASLASAPTVAGVGTATPPSGPVSTAEQEHHMMLSEGGTVAGRRLARCRTTHAGRILSIPRRSNGLNSRRTHLGVVHPMLGAGDPSHRRCSCPATHKGTHPRLPMWLS